MPNVYKVTFCWDQGIARYDMHLTERDTVDLLTDTVCEMRRVDGISDSGYNCYAFQFNDLTGRLCHLGILTASSLERQRD